MSGVAAHRPPPEGYRTVALGAGDIPAVIAMVNRCEIHDSGLPMWDEADLGADITVPGFDVDRDWLGVHDGEQLIAWAMLTDPRRAWVDVDPGHRGRGLGAWLREWSERRAADLGAAEVGQTLEDSCAPAIELLRAAGYRPDYVSWVLHRQDDPTAAPPESAIPDGVTIRPAAPEEGDTALLLIEEAFRAFPGRTPTPLETWRAWTFGREGFRPEDLPVAVADGRVVGAAFLIESAAEPPEVWVDKLGVVADQRHRGIARALLHHAFQRSHRLGHGRTALSTDSRTGALSLYEKVGMTVTSSYTRWVRPL